MCIHSSCTCNCERNKTKNSEYISYFLPVLKRSLNRCVYTYTVCCIENCI